MNIEAELEELLKREGGYVNHPADRGGPTNFGITQAVARATGYAGDMRNLPRETAKAIYRKQYWTAPGFDRIDRLAPAVAAELFDTGVNMGTGVAARFLQRALNTFSGGLVVDGQIGQKTLDALSAFLLKRGNRGHLNLVKVLNGFQVERYAEIVEKNPSQRAFFYGWIDARVA
ncbi:hypothetical protein BSL82_10205 [Tardibacter chloracetimidivorans]|uniref:Uncharacterized protein n=1 Tax=Tardibacter chloracetimidivorans TaxID=1921510 RepID=A0A1L3ZVK5_9SPHN|nr:glycosyl hydrolase 108 family protein [Tardibacter chloracetimidivorans]API59645.1 hypothetical protein BSL82_10205 [Tardibacter chloracetimidivorans]